MPRKYKTAWSQKEYAEHPERGRGRSAKYRVKNPHLVIYNKIRSLAKQFGHAPLSVTPDEFKDWFESRPSQCEICGAPKPAERKLCCDHDHQTGRLRGTLCQKCNAQLGVIEKFIDNKEFRDQVRSYLRKGNDVIAKLKEQRTVMFDYMMLRVELQDMHGVSDAAADIREIDAKISVLTEIRR